jgi:EpsI family protein
MSGASRKWLVALCVPLLLKLGDVGLIRLSSQSEKQRIDLSQLPQELGEWSGRDQSVPPEQVRSLGREAVVQREYTDGSGCSVQAAFIYSNRREGLHLPENCLVSQGWTLLRQTTVGLKYGPQQRQTASANLVVAMNTRQQATVELYLFVDAHKTATGWGSQYLDMLRHGRAGGKMVCLLLLTGTTTKDQTYEAVQASLTALMAQVLPHVHRSLGAGAQRR